MYGIAGDHAVVLLQLQRRGAPTLTRSIATAIGARILTPVLSTPASSIGSICSHSNSRSHSRSRSHSHAANVDADAGSASHARCPVISVCQRSRRQRRRAKVTGIIAELSPPPLIVLPVVAEQAPAAQNQLLFRLEHLVLLDKGALLRVLQNTALLRKATLLRLAAGGHRQRQHTLRLRLRLQRQHVPLLQQLLLLMILSCRCQLLPLATFLTSAARRVRIIAHFPDRCVTVYAIHMIQHIGLIIDAGSAYICIRGRTMTMPTVPMAMIVASCGTGRGRFAIHWLLALHIRLVQQRKLTAAVALQFPSRILKAAIEDSATLAAGQTLSEYQKRARERDRQSESGSERKREREAKKEREREKRRQQQLARASTRAKVKGSFVSDFIEKLKTSARLNKKFKTKTKLSNYEIV